MTDGLLGLVLAAGAGSRFGMPKALARTEEGVPWLHRATAVLTEGGCAEVVVVLGACAESALHLVPPGATPVVARDWSEGQSASLAAGLTASDASGAAAVVITLVDLPDLNPAAVRRVAAGARAGDLRRATYDGTPGHPVVVGRNHWTPLREVLRGDRGAAAYLRSQGAEDVDCTDLGGGQDVDSTRATNASRLPSSREIRSSAVSVSEITGPPGFSFPRT